MANFEDNIKNIRKLYLSLTGKDVDVSLLYRGTSFGITKPWNLRIDSREINHSDYQQAAEDLLIELKNDLDHKASSLENQAIEYRKTLSQFAN